MKPVLYVCIPVIFAGAYVDLKNVIAPEKKTSSNTTNSSSVSLQSDALFVKINDRIKEDLARAKQINGIFLYNITKDGKTAKQWGSYLHNFLILI